MAALVTMAAAKDHLRETDDKRDADIYLKLEQANDIIMNYLKNRTNAIVSISVANPTVITTSTPHSLVTGTSYTMTGTTTTPTVNGAQVVTVTGPTTFTVPVNVTVGQSASAGTVGPPVWTDVTVPRPVQAAILLTLADLNEHRPVNWDVLGNLLMRFRDPALA